MEAIVEYVQYASKHPYINPIINWVLQIEVNHFWGPIHESSMLFEALFVVIYFGFGYCLEFDLFCAAATQITEFGYSFREQDVLDLQILVNHSQVMHFFNSLRSFPEDVDDFSLAEGSIGLLGRSQQIVDCFFCQFHEDVAFEEGISLYLMEPMVPNYVFAGGEFLHYLNLVAKIVPLLLSLADQLLKGVLFLRVNIFHQYHIPVSSLRDLVQLPQSLARNMIGLGWLEQ